MARDYIPVRDKDFNDWFKFLNQYVAQIERLPRRDPYPPSGPYRAGQRLCRYHRYPVDTEAKAMIRPFVNQYLCYALEASPAVRADAVSSGAIIRYTPLRAVAERHGFMGAIASNIIRAGLLPEFSRQG